MFNVCGLCKQLTCERCKLFQSGECKGCESSTYCPLPKCAKEHGVKTCFECPEFPCQLFREKGPLVNEILDFFSENLQHR